jgi:hypothetical protein
MNVKFLKQYEDFVAFKPIQVNTLKLKQLRIKQSRLKQDLNLNQSRAKNFTHLFPMLTMNQA